jgi:hypothetical protein
MTDIQGLIERYRAGTLTVDEAFDALDQNDPIVLRALFAIESAKRAAIELVPIHVRLVAAP